MSVHNKQFKLYKVQLSIDKQSTYCSLLFEKQHMDGDIWGKSSVFCLFISSFLYFLSSDLLSSQFICSEHTLRPTWRFTVFTWQRRSTTQLEYLATRYLRSVACDQRGRHTKVLSEIKNDDHQGPKQQVEKVYQPSFWFSECCRCVEQHHTDNSATATMDSWGFYMKPRRMRRVRSCSSTNQTQHHNNSKYYFQPSTLKTMKIWFRTE